MDFKKIVNLLKAFFLQNVKQRGWLMKAVVYTAITNGS
jgi:hypothetical protein